MITHLKRKKRSRLRTLSNKKNCLFTTSQKIAHIHNSDIVPIVPWFNKNFMMAFTLIIIIHVFFTWN